MDFTYPSSYGVIHSAWTVKGSTAEWHVTIPANATGLLDVSDASGAQYSIDGSAAAKSKLVHATSKGIELPAGSYTFAVKLK